MKCPKCNSEGEIMEFTFKAWGLCPPETLYKGHCPGCGFEAHQSSRPEQAAAWFAEGITKSPLFTEWADAQKGRVKQ